MYILTSKERKCLFNNATHDRILQSAIFSSLKVLFYWNPVRFIDAFVEVLALQTIGFSQTIRGRSPEL
jgi:hypothetical protein